MTRPNRYVLGGNVEIDMYPTDLNSEFFVPAEVRLSIKEPDGDIITVSGGELTVASGYLYWLYKPESRGWFEYESWVKDSTGREAAQTNGFEVIDRVY